MELLQTVLNLVFLMLASSEAHAKQRSPGLPVRNVDLIIRRSTQAATKLSEIYNRRLTASIRRAGATMVHPLLRESFDHLLSSNTSDVDHRDPHCLIYLQSFFSILTDMLFSTYCHEMYWAGNFGGPPHRSTTYPGRYDLFIKRHLYNIEALLEQAMLTYSREEPAGQERGAESEMSCGNQTYTYNRAMVDIHSYIALHNMVAVLRAWHQTLLITE